MKTLTDEELLAAQDQAVASFPPIHPDAQALSAVEYARELEIRKARAVLSRHARPAIEPVPVSERPWEREGWCDTEGRCWWGRIEGNPANPEWFLAGLSEIEEFYEIGDWVVLLPHHALPVPEVQP